MAEAVVFSLASKILSAIASPTFNMAYEKGVSIWEAGGELAKLRESVRRIQAVLLDAEKKQEGSDAVKNWIKRLKGVLYDAEDLFDEELTEDLVKQHMMDGKNKNKVRVSCSKLNPIVSRDNLVEKVKAIRKNLVEISTDMAQFQFVICLDERSIYNMGKWEDQENFVDAESVIGREKDKRTMLNMLISNSECSKSNKSTVFAIVGIGGMGKTTLAQLIYNDEEIRYNFENRWFACISNISDEREVLGKIFQSIRGQSCSEFDVGQLHTKIRESIKDKKYLLVLDDVWEDNRTKWQDRMSLLNSHASESRIIVTTRLPSVATAMGALRLHNLEGLSEDDSWSLLKKSAFTEEYENDPRRESLGKQILKKCSGVPLAIRSIGGLIYWENTIEEWETIAREDLPMLGRKYNDKTMSVLKLSYDHLSSYFKHCFAYCSLFPKDYVFSKRDLINHWSAQGYIDPNIDPNDEEASFMHLLRRGFFQQAKKEGSGEIESCKMHDLMHDLAIYVAGEESVVLSSKPLNTRSCVRHASFEISNGNESLDISTLVLNAKSIRSLLLTSPSGYAIESSKLGQLFASVKLLRTLNLSKLGIEKIPPSIGELKLMRHLDLSCNYFEELPQSVAYLVNLLSLNLEQCRKFKVWPLNFYKLTKLRYLNLQGCNDLKLMPMGIEKMTHLQYLSDFKTAKWNDCLNSSATLLQQLRGKLSIQVNGNGDGDGEEDNCNCQLPIFLQELEISGYRGMRMPGWGDYGWANSLASLKLIGCMYVKYLPPLRCLPFLRLLSLEDLKGIEFMEGEEGGRYLFFRSLEELRLEGLLNLKRWRRKIASGETCVQFPRLRRLSVYDCPHLEFESFPRWQHSLEHLKIRKWCTLASPHLEKVDIGHCNELLSIEMVAQQHLQDIVILGCQQLKSIDLVEEQTPTPSFRSLSIRDCSELKSLRASAQLIAGLEHLRITNCLKLKLKLATSPTALNLGGSKWSVEAKMVGDIGLIEQLSWLPFQNVGIAQCIMPIMFPATPFMSLRMLEIQDADGLENLQLDGSPLLQEVYIMICKRLTSVEVEAPICIEISGCPALKNLRIADPSALKELSIEECPELEEAYEHQLSAVPFKKHVSLFIRMERIIQRPSIIVRRRSGEEATHT